LALFGVVRSSLALLTKMSRLQTTVEVFRLREE
jgi:hypothetical protein